LALLSVVASVPGIISQLAGDADINPGQYRILYFPHHKHKVERTNRLLRLPKNTGQ